VSLTIARLTVPICAYCITNDQFVNAVIRSSNTVQGAHQRV